MAYKILKSGTHTVKLPGTGGQFIPAQPMVGMNLQNARSFNMGNGDTAAHMDAQGFWLGAEAFADAPFSVDMEGNAKMVSSSTGEDFARVVTINGASIYYDSLNRLVGITGNIPDDLSEL